MCLRGAGGPKALQPTALLRECHWTSPRHAHTLQLRGSWAPHEAGKGEAWRPRVRESLRCSPTLSLAPPLIPLWP